MSADDCNGICVRASDVGVMVAGDPVAYPHPACPVHGDVDWCEHCNGWGSIGGLPRAFTCPMCGGDGVRAKDGVL